MGKGDKKSKRGKIISGTYGVRRQKKGGKTPVVIAKPEKVKETPAKKTVTEEIKPETKAPTVKKPAAKKTAVKKAAPKKTTTKEADKAE